MAEKRYLISIGINDYDVKPLDYCVKDSEDICIVFKTFCDVEKDNCFNIISDLTKPNFNVFESVEKVI